MQALVCRGKQHGMVISNKASGSKGWITGEVWIQTHKPQSVCISKL